MELIALRKILTEAREAIAEARELGAILSPSSAALLRRSWNSLLRRQRIGRQPGEVEQGIELCRRHGFNVSSSPDLPFTVTSRPENVLFRLQRAVFERVAQRTSGFFVYPAMGFDTHVLPERGQFLEISPDAPLLRKGDAPRFRSIQKLVQDVTPAELERARQQLGGKKPVLVLKGIQSIVSEPHLESFIEKVAPSQIMLMDSPASGFTRIPQGFPTITPELLRLLRRKGFEDATHRYFSEDERDLLEEVHSSAQQTLSFGSGHFPCVRVKVFERRG